jgi:hypothetical protein
MNGRYGSIRDFEALRVWALFMQQIEQRQDMPAEYSAVVDRKFWELIRDSDNGEV